MGRDREKPVWGSSGGDRPRHRLVIVGVAALGLLGVVGLSFLMAALLRSGAAGSPLGTALGLGCLMILFLAGSIGLLLAAAGRFAEGSVARRTVVIGGLGVLMGFAPLLMILVVYLLSRGATP